MKANSDRTKCMKKTDLESWSPAGRYARRSQRSVKRNAQLKREATIKVKEGNCRREKGGAIRCPLGVGYLKSPGRTGTLFLPPGYKWKKLPFMLLLHGSGWDGSDMINVFREYAIKYRFAIVAPDSYNPMYWRAPETAQDPYTTDFFHIQACWDRAMNRRQGIRVNPWYRTSFGNSRASYAAVAFASRSRTRFRSAAVLHAAALPQQMGPTHFPILWVTGTNDPLYGPKPARKDVAAFRKGRPDFKIQWEKWVDNHTIRNYTQIEAMITWWLKKSPRDRIIQTY